MQIWRLMRLGGVRYKSQHIVSWLWELNWTDFEFHWYLKRKQKLRINSILRSGNLRRLLITYANSLDPDQAPKNVGPDLGINCTP